MAEPTFDRGERPSMRSLRALADEAGSPYTVRAYAPTDEDSVLELHARAFGHPWPRAYWRWRTSDAPSGRPQAVGVWDDTGCCRAIFAGVALACRYRGEPGVALSGSNSVLDPGLRRSLAGARLFLRVVNDYFARFGGGDVRMMYGSPILPLVRAMAVHTRVEVLGDVYSLVHDLGPSSPVAGASELRVQCDGSLPADVDDLWRACSGAMANSVVRDRAFLQWRFAQHPEVAYELVTARASGGALRGLMVLRNGGWHADVLTICEWLVPGGDSGAESALLAHAFGAARQRAAAAVVAVFSPAAPEHAHWQRHYGFRGHPTSHQLMFRRFSRCVDRDYLFDNWRVTGADLEFL